MAALLGVTPACFTVFGQDWLLEEGQGVLLHHILPSVEHGLLKVHDAPAKQLELLRHLQPSTSRPDAHAIPDFRWVS